MRLTLAIIPLLVASGAPASAETFYIAPTGSDSTGNGSAEKPWATLARAAQGIPDDGSTVLAMDGTYEGAQSIGRRFGKVATFKAQNPYRARLRSAPPKHRVFYIYDACNVVVDGFEIEGAPSVGEFLVHIGSAGAHHIVFQNNVIHDSYDNDLVKINDRAHHVTFRGNVMYNVPKPGDEHMDINTVTDVTVEDNIFFNDFTGSGRPNANNTHPFVLIKNSGSAFVTERFQVRRNVFLNWEGAPDQPFLLIGEDGKPFLEAKDVTVENNLFLGNSPNRIQSVFGVKGAGQIVFRANTAVGDMPHGEWGYAVRISREDANPVNEAIAFHNNIWSSPGGAMGFFSSGKPEDSKGVVLNRNLYWNGGKPILPRRNVLNVTDDPAALVADPLLASPKDVILPRWDREKGAFRSGSKTIREELVRLVMQYGALKPGSPAIDAADPANMPEDDILGRPRPKGGKPDLGAFELEAGSRR
jgi:hypothetical protein